MPSYKTHCVLFGLALAFLLPGCSGSSDNLDDASEEGNEIPSAQFNDGLIMTIQTWDKRQGKYDTAQIIKNPDEAEVKKQFQSLNWTDPELRPSVKFVRMKEGQLDSMLGVRRNQESAEGDIQAEWISSEKRESIAPKIESTQRALEILLLFLGDKPDLEKNVEWKSIE